MKKYTRTLEDRIASLESASGTMSSKTPILFPVAEASTPSQASATAPMNQPLASATSAPPARMKEMDSSAARPVPGPQTPLALPEQSIGFTYPHKTHLSPPQHFPQGQSSGIIRFSHQLSSKESGTAGNDNQTTGNNPSSNRIPPQLLVCLLDAYDNLFHRQDLATWTWLRLRLIWPAFHPWKWDEGIWGPNSHLREEISATENQLPGSCTIAPMDAYTKRRPFVRINRSPFHFWCTNCTTKHQVDIPYHAKIKLGMGDISKQEWHDRLKYTIECSHLCGNFMCANPFHVILESSRDNNAPKPCHYNGRCDCGADIKCLADLAVPEDQVVRHSIAQIERNLDSIRVCPAPKCDFEVGDGKAVIASQINKAMRLHWEDRHGDIVQLNGTDS